MFPIMLHIRLIVQMMRPAESFFFSGLADVALGSVLTDETRGESDPPPAAATASSASSSGEPRTTAHVQFQ